MKSKIYDIVLESIPADLFKKLKNEWTSIPRGTPPSPREKKPTSIKKTYRIGETRVWTADEK